METDQRCKSEFDGSRCVKPVGHHGKHLNDQDQYVMWTTSGVAQHEKELPIKA
jgi:hypothetical protein